MIEISKSFIYWKIVKPVYNSHPLLRKATENFGKLSGDRNIQGDRFMAVIYRLDCILRLTFTYEIKINFSCLKCCALSFL